MVSRNTATASTAAATTTTTTTTTAAATTAAATTTTTTTATMLDVHGDSWGRGRRAAEGAWLCGSCPVQLPAAESVRLYN